MKKTNQNKKQEKKKGLAPPKKIKFNIPLPDSAPIVEEIDKNNESANIPTTKKMKMEKQEIEEAPPAVGQQPRSEFAEEFRAFHEKLNLMQPSVILSLHPKYFQFLPQNICYPYNLATRKMITAILDGRLESELEQILESICFYKVYYWGCIVVEVHDYGFAGFALYPHDETVPSPSLHRKPFPENHINQSDTMQIENNQGKSTSNLVKTEKSETDLKFESVPKAAETETTPITYRILLRPTSETTLADVEKIVRGTNREWTQDETLVLEQKILLHASPPLCLDPSLNVFFISTMGHFNQTKSPIQQSNWLYVTNYGHQEKAKPKERFGLLKFLKQKTIETSHQPETFSTQIHKSFNRALSKIPKPTPAPFEPHATPPLMASSSLTQAIDDLKKKARVRFQFGHTGLICYFEVQQQSVTFEGVMKLMKDQAPAPDSITKFPLGTLESANILIDQLFVEFEKEGHKLTPY